MSDSMNEPVTRAELREELAKLATHFALEMWIGALREQLIADAQQREDRLKADAQQGEDRLKADAQQREERITSTITKHVSTEIARHVGAVLERTRTEIGAVDEKYRDVPPRLANVEASAHTHTEPSPKKVTGRRSR